MKNKNQIWPILRAIILVLAIIPIIEISARRGGGASRGGSRTGGRRSTVRASGRRPVGHRPNAPTKRPISRPSQIPSTSTRPNAGQRPGVRPGNLQPGGPGQIPKRPGSRPYIPSGRPDHRPIIRPGNRPINIYAGGYGYGGYYDNYGYDTVGTIKYATLDKTRGSAPDVYCSQACSEQHGLNWNGNSWCDETTCYCECSI